ncbi:DNA repair protein RecO, partial [Calditrichota bacterium]
MSLIKTEAIVIKSMNWRDTSKIVSLYTREAGRIDVIAKGVRRKNHPHGSFLESLNHLETVIYISEKRELQNLGNTSQLNSFYKIRQDLNKTSFGLAILEIVNLFFSPGETDVVFFDFLISQINALNESSHPQVVFWFFILKISSYLGFKPRFENCQICKKLKDEDYYFQVSSGAAYYKECAGETSLF